MREILEADRDTLAGDGLDRLHSRVRADDIACVALAEAFAAALGADGALARALVAVAGAADRSGRNNAFHNPAHSREVGMNWWLLARLQVPALPRDAVLLGLIAAFGHDLDHDGKGNGSGEAYLPFRLERVAADAVVRLMRDAGAAEAEVAAVTAMILCTDVRSGYPYLTGGGPDDPRFAPLRDDMVLLSARMLRDADLLPSAGTSIAAYRARTAELERELGLALSGERAAGFFDGVVERRFLSPAAQLFLPNLAVIAAAATGR